MKQRSWKGRVALALLWLVPGTMTLATSCGKEFRDAAVGAASDFVSETIGDVLGTLFPVGNWLNPPAA